MGPGFQYRKPRQASSSRPFTNSLVMMASSWGPRLSSHFLTRSEPHDGQGGLQNPTPPTFPARSLHTPRQKLHSCYSHWPFHLPVAMSSQSPHLSTTALGTFLSSHPAAPWRPQTPNTYRCECGQLCNSPVPGLDVAVCAWTYIKAHTHVVYTYVRTHITHTRRGVC